MTSALLVNPAPPLRRLFWATLLACGLLGCASAPPLPPQLKDPARHPSFKRKAYVTAIGFGKDPQAAMSFARSNVAKQVKSSIESELRSAEQEVSRNDKVQSRTNYWRQVRERSSFEHGELIKDEPAQFDGRQYIAFAYLSRRDVDKALARQQEESQQIINEAYCRARAAVVGLGSSYASKPASCQHQSWQKNVDATSFGKALADFEPAHVRWQSAFLQRRAIRGWNSPVADAVGPWHGELLAASGELRRRTVWLISVVPQGKAPTDILAKVGSATSEALRTLGAKTVMAKTADPCATTTAADAVRYGLRVQVAVDSRLAGLGWRAEIKLPSTGRACSGSATGFQVDLSAGKAKGINPSSQDRALRKALSKVDGAAISKALRAPVDSLSPLH